MATLTFRRVRSTHDPDAVALEKYRDTPPDLSRYFCKRNALLLAESSIYTKLYHDTAPICIAMLLQKYQVQGSLEDSPQIAPKPTKNLEVQYSEIDLGELSGVIRASRFARFARITRKFERIGRTCYENRGCQLRMIRAKRIARATK